MSRIERIGDATLYLGRCEDLLQPCEAIVTDPPYGIGITKRATVGTSKAATARDYGKSDWDHAPCPSETIAAMRACSRHQIIFGGNFFDLPPSSCWLVWDKLNTGDFADCELAWTNLPKAVRRIQWRWNGMIRRGDDEREHPTQKPVGVMAWAIEQLPENDGIIQDPFLGAGSTGIACARLGRRFIGIECHEPYFDIAVRRIEQALRQKDLFVHAPIAPVDQRAADLFAEPTQ